MFAASDPATPGEIATSTPAVISTRPASRQVRATCASSNPN